VQFGANTFYYYGAGGGGVAYPDRYYFNQRGVPIEIVFDGPYTGEGKSPGATAQEMERLVLESFIQDFNVIR
jgi:hypothetical protein